ncbi:MAG TPA: hypothetical protein VF384_08055 [Planctomycetota bacterium]
MKYRRYTALALAPSAGSFPVLAQEPSSSDIGSTDAATLGQQPPGAAPAVIERARTSTIWSTPGT